MKNTRLSKGFTLIELLIVITIIGILAVALLPSVLGAPARARDAARKADLNNIIAALETYNSDNQDYPDNDLCMVDGSILDDYFQGGTPPADPQSKGIGDAGAAFDSCSSYYYCKLDGNPSSYAIAAYMEIKNDGNAISTDMPTDCGDSATDVAGLSATTDSDHIFMILK